MIFKKKHSTSLAWIDEFIANVRPYIFVRTEDNILIKRPNQATKINSSGAQILKYLLDGGTTAELAQKLDSDKLKDTELFLIAVKAFLEGNIDEFSLNPAVDTSPFQKEFSKLPILSEFAITYKCNLKCRFCYAGCNCTSSPVGEHKELNESECLKIIDTIYNNAKVPSISFTGGEPTLKRDLLIKCITHAHKLGMRVNLITNGTLIDKQYAKELVLAGLDSAQVSIEGTTAETHDKLVAMKGAFEKSINTVAYFKALGIHVHTNTTLNRLNLKEAVSLPAFVKKMGLDRFSMNLVIPTGSSAINSELVIDYSVVGKYIEDIHAISKKQDIEFMWYSPVPMCMFNSITEGLGNKGCAACDGLLSVAPNGDVLPCASYDQSVGNISENSFVSVWNNAQSTSFRNKEFAHEICQKCEHLPICNGACPLYWRNKGFQELIQHQKEQVL